MKSESKYRIILLDCDGCEISDREADSITHARHEAKYMMSDAYARMAETDDLGWVRCQIVRRDGEIIEDWERE